MPRVRYVDPKGLPRKSSWMEVVRAILYFSSENKGKLIFLNSVVFVVLFYSLIPPLLAGKIVDFFVDFHRGDSVTPAYWYAFVLGASYVIVSLIRLKAKNVLERISIAARTKAKVLGFERLMEFSLKWHAQENTGNKVQRILTGSQALYDWAELISQKLWPVTVHFISVLVFFLFTTPIFSLFLVLYAGIFFTIEHLYNKKLKRLSDELNQHRERSSGAFVEGTGNILAVKAMGASASIHSKITASEKGAQEIEFQLSNTGFTKWYWFQTLNGLTYMGFIFLVVHRVSAGDLSLGSVLVFISYFNNLRESANDMSGLTSKMLRYRSDLLRMMPIFDETAPVRSGNAAFPRQWQEIAITEGGFKYASGQVGLHSLDFTLKRGERLGVAGTSGGGKSTLAKVLLGLYELENGSFTIGNKKYYDISHEEISKNLAIVLQETELFNLSLEENITVMRDVDPELLASAIEISGLTEVVARLPEGLDTIIGERGYFLSGGERQRLGIARALYKNSPIIVLDEATSALDIKTEKHIIDNLLGGLDRNKTLLVIAHRLSTLKNTDRVIVFEKGTIVEEGTYDKLIKQPTSKLGHLYALQTARKKGV